MDGNELRSAYRLAVREERGAWRWTLLQGETVAMTGEAPAWRTPSGAPSSPPRVHAAFEKIGRRRF
ncbi:hypothetical protein ACRAWD_02685 [Caulobacter segnis]